MLSLQGLGPGWHVLPEHRSGPVQGLPSLQVPGSMTVVVCVAELLAGDGVPSSPVTDAVFERIVPFPAHCTTWTTSVIVLDPPDARNGLEQEMVPVPPIEGVVHVQPGAARDWNVVPAGRASVNVRLQLSPAPTLLTTML